LLIEIGEKSMHIHVLWHKFLTNGVSVYHDQQESSIKELTGEYHLGDESGSSCLLVVSHFLDEIFSQDPDKDINDYNYVHESIVNKVSKRFITKVTLTDRHGLISSSYISECVVCGCFLSLAEAGF
jgi:hypothetical protein